MEVKCPRCGHVFVIEVKGSGKKRKYKERKRDPVKKLKKIVSFLKKQEDWVWIRKISKFTGVKPYAVSYLIDKYLQPYLEILEPEDVYEATGIKMKMVRLKNPEMDFSFLFEDISKRKS